MAQKVDDRAWEKWPDEVLTEVNAASWVLGTGYEASGDYSECRWDEWKTPGQSWVATSGEDFPDAFDFAEEVWRRGKASSLGVDVIVRDPEVVFFRFVDCTDQSTRLIRKSGLKPAFAYGVDDLDDLMDDEAA
ncbi:hypothetical protein AB0H18_10615 [Streptomyces sp. NPDC020766]|uniref:hypothetical protein n=1 Tax=Streptomyces sp. NPDC020766 TaxID=3155011 RepID=UPI0033D39216